MGYEEFLASKAWAVPTVSVDPAVEEWDELRAAVHANDLEAIHREALQVAAVAYRLAAQTADPSAAFSRRSTGT